MTECCRPATDRGGGQGRQTAACPGCGRPGRAVARITLLHRVAAPLNRRLPPEAFFFCNNPDCRLVYFSEAAATVSIERVRGEVGQKSTDRSRPLCYCFDLTYGQVLDELSELGHSPSRAFVVEQTRLKRCACAIRNPSGRCCLGDFPAAEAGA